MYFQCFNKINLLNFLEGFYNIHEKENNDYFNTFTKIPKTLKSIVSSSLRMMGSKLES